MILPYSFCLRARPALLLSAQFPELLFGRYKQIIVSNLYINVYRMILEIYSHVDYA